MTKVQVVLIETENGPVRINHSDYDVKVHKLLESKNAEKELEKGNDQEETKPETESGDTNVEDNSDEVNTEASEADQEPATEVQPTEADQTSEEVKYFVFPKGEGEFIITDASGVQVKDSVYKTQAGAEKGIKALKGK